MSTYAERTDVETRYGTANVRQMADMNNTGDETDIANRIDKALEWGAAYIDDKMQNGPYRVPLVEATHGGGVGPRVVDWNARLAGVWLYNLRQQDRLTTFFAGVEEAVINEMNRVMQGWVTIPCEIDPDKNRHTMKVVRG